MRVNDVIDISTAIHCALCSHVQAAAAMQYESRV